MPVWDRWTPCLLRAPTGQAGHGLGMMGSSREPWLAELPSECHCPHPPWSNSAQVAELAPGIRVIYVIDTMIVFNDSGTFDKTTAKFWKCQNISLCN